MRAMVLVVLLLVLPRSAMAMPLSPRVRELPIWPSFFPSGGAYGVANPSNVGVFGAYLAGAVAPSTRRFHGH
jgi:hypothetical protein